jgi:hypothetical protein
MRPAVARDLPVEGAFALDQLQVTGNDVELPARSVEHFKTAVKLPEWQISLLDQLSLPDILDRFRRTFSTKTEVRLFIGTHLEAVPGRCVLPLTDPLIEP